MSSVCTMQMAPHAAQHGGWRRVKPVHTSSDMLAHHGYCSCTLQRAAIAKWLPTDAVKCAVPLPCRCPAITLTAGLNCTGARCLRCEVARCARAVAEAAVAAHSHSHSNYFSSEHMYLMG